MTTDLIVGIITITAICLGMGGAWLAIVVSGNKRFIKAYGIKTNDYHALSYYSQDLIRDYHKLPDDSKSVLPNFYDTLLRLDTKYGGSEFLTVIHDKPREYRELSIAIWKLIEAARQREIAIKASTVPDIDSEVELLTARIRSEVSIMEQVTKEIV